MRRSLALGLFAPAIFLVAACGEGDTTIVTGGQQQAGIAVEGLGEVEAIPDTGFLTIGVSVEATTVATAREGAATAATAVIQAAKARGVVDRDIQTINFAIYPRYEYINGREPRLIGYTVSNDVVIKLRKIDDIGVVLDEAAAAGGDAVRVQSIRFDIEDNARLLEQAREAAMNNARQKAEQLARLGGVTLGAPISITEFHSTAPPPELSRDDARLASAFQTPIQPGTGRVTVQLSVVWAIVS
jgi:uncharacterized protein YggE